MTCFLEPERGRDEAGSLGRSLWAEKALIGSPGPDMFCLFHGKRYSPGESWHPYLEPQGLMYCLRCTCSEVGSHGHLATYVGYVGETSREVTSEGGRKPDSGGQEHYGTRLPRNLGPCHSTQYLPPPLCTSQRSVTQPVGGWAGPGLGAHLPSQPSFRLCWCQYPCYLRSRKEPCRPGLPVLPFLILCPAALSCHAALGRILPNPLVQRAVRQGFGQMPPPPVTLLDPSPASISFFWDPT